MRKIIRILIAAMMISFLFTNFVFTYTIAERWPTITIEAEPQIVVDVSPGSVCRITIFGNITCNSSTLDDVTVRLTLELDKCRGAISPSIMTFYGIGNETKDMFVNISLPMRTSSYETPSATIEGTWTQGALSGEIEPYAIQVIVLPYSRANIRLYGPKEVTPGESTDFPIRITNVGNIDDMYRFEIVNYDRLEGDGITVGVIDDITISQNETVNINVNVRTSSDTPIRVHRIDVVTTSLVQEEPIAYEYSLYIQVKSGFVQILTNPLTIVIIAVVIITFIVVYLRRNKTSNSPNP